jgi:hypothetical protein
MHNLAVIPGAVQWRLGRWLCGVRRQRGRRIRRWLNLWRRLNLRRNDGPEWQHWRWRNNRAQRHDRLRRDLGDTWCHSTRQRDGAWQYRRRPQH